VGDVLMGLNLGLLATYWFNVNGFYIGNMGITGLLVSDRIFAKLTMDNIIRLSVMTFVVTLLAGLFPAIMASRMEPVQALRAEK